MALVVMETSGVWGVSGCGTGSHGDKWCMVRRWGVSGCGTGSHGDYVEMGWIGKRCVSMEHM